MNFFGKKQKEIYLDHVSTTPVRKEVFEVMKPYWSEKFGNAGEKHRLGREAKIVLEQARENVAKILNTSAKEIIFTSGGTESNNLAILGFFNFIKSKTGTLNGYHAITSEIEHSSVLEIFKHLEKDGLEVSYIKVDKDGIVDLREIKEKIKNRTLMISIMFVNNEIGTIQPIEEIAKIIRKERKSSAIFSPQNNELKFPIFHTDASQAPLFLDLDVKKLGVDMFTIDGQKIYGPKGIGALYIKKEVPIQSISFGGKQEHGLRAGTENIPLIVGFSKALEMAQKEKENFSKRILELQNYFIDEILKNIPNSKLNGSREQRIPNNINISFENIDHEFLAVQLDENGIFCSTKSACLNDKNKDSYVLNAINRNSNKSGAIRFSLGKETTQIDINYVVNILNKLIGGQRENRM
ncbi:MAG: cysteine desulfurase family protein [Candidatus Paceibacterota bacterium]